MKTFVIYLMFFLAGNIAFAQNNATSNDNDPQITDRNYKHPNKAAKATRLGTDNHYVTQTTSTEDNTNYKTSFGKADKTNKAVIATGETTRSYSGRTSSRNYKKQF